MHLFSIKLTQELQKRKPLIADADAETKQSLLLMNHCLFVLLWLTNRMGSIE
jgi:hypothetical protein